MQSVLDPAKETVMSGWRDNEARLLVEGFGLEGKQFAAAVIVALIGAVDLLLFERPGLAAFAVLLILAGATYLAPRLLMASILGAIKVSVWTMRAASLFTSPYIDEMCNWFEMARIYAGSYSAEMVKLQAGRRWPDKQGVGNNVRTYGPSGRAVHAKLTIPSRSERCRPYPAWPEVGTVSRDRAVEIDVRPKTLFKRRPRRKAAEVAALIVVMRAAKAATKTERCAVGVATMVTHRKSYPFGVRGPDASTSRPHSIIQREARCPTR